MAGAAVLAVISFAGIVSAVLWIASVSLGIHRDDRRGALSIQVTRSRLSRIARQATGAHGFRAQV